MIQYVNPKNQATTNKTVQFQDWAPYPAFIDLVYNTEYPASLVFAPNFTFKIKDFYEVPAYIQYGSFFMSKNFQYTAGGSSIPWIKPSSYSQLGVIPNSNLTIQGKQLIPENNLSFVFNPEFQNINLLVLGTYIFKISFSIYGQVNSSSPMLLLDTYDFNIILNVIDQSLTTVPAALNFTHYQNTPLPDIPLSVSGNNWNVVTNFISQKSRYLEFNYPDSGVTISTTTASNGAISHSAIGNGNKGFNIQLTNYYDNAQIDPNFLSGYLAVFQGTQLVLSIPFNITLLNQHTFNSSPSNLHFQAFLGIAEPAAQNINYNCVAPVTVTAPYWLNCTLETIALPTTNQTVVVVQPISFANLSPGVYTGVVTLTATINGVLSTRTISVTYKLDDFISLPYQNNFGFTLDPKFLGFSTTTINTYFNIAILVRVYDYFQQTYVDHKIPEKLIPFKQKGKINIGLLVHKIMSRFTTFNESLNQYLPASVTIYISENDLNLNTMIRDITLPTINFIAGLENGFNKFGFLKFNLLPTRVTVNSFAYLNFKTENTTVLKSNFYNLEVYRNSNLEDTISIAPDDGFIICKKVTFQTYQQGDIITYKLIDRQTLEFREQKYLVFPEGPFSNMIVWEDEYLLQSALELTGGYSLGPEYEYTLNTLQRNLVKCIQTLKVERNLTLKISTGWISKTTINDIDSLLMSKKVVLITDEGQINLVPQTKSKIDEDSERELVEFNLEFTINKDYNEKVYHF